MYLEAWAHQVIIMMTRSSKFSVCSLRMTFSCDSGAMLNDLYCFNSTTSSWVEFGGDAMRGAPTPRIAFGFISLSGMLYVFGGQTLTQTITAVGKLSNHIQCT